MDEYLKFAGEKNDADETERVITCPGPDGFTRVVLDCRGATADMSFSFDEPLENSTKIVHLEPGDIYDEIVTKGGFRIYYKGAGSFRYQTY